MLTIEIQSIDKLHALLTELDVITYLQHLASGQAVQTQYPLPSISFWTGRPMPWFACATLYEIKILSILPPTMQTIPYRHR